jgi:hypothetical protein
LSLIYSLFHRVVRRGVVVAHLPSRAILLSAADRRRVHTKYVDAWAEAGKRTEIEAEEE